MHIEKQEKGQLDKFQYNFHITLCIEISDDSI